MYRRHDFSALIVTDPRRAAREMVDAYRRARCSRREMARLLGCSEGNTLARWVARLEAAGTGITAAMKRLKRAAKAEGWHHTANKRGGRRARRARCSRREMARLLGCSEGNTLARWVARLEAAGTGITAAMKRLKRAAKAEGWHHTANKRGGRRAKAVAA